jgi:hypothetical protein
MDSARDIAISKGVDFVLVATNTKKGAKAHIQGVKCNNYTDASVIDDSTLDRYVMCKSCVAKLSKYPDANPKGKGAVQFENEPTEVIEEEDTIIHSDDEPEDSDYDDSDVDDSDVDDVEGDEMDVEGDEMDVEDDVECDEIGNDSGDESIGDLGGDDDDMYKGDDDDEPYKDESNVAKGKKKGVVNDNTAFKNALRKYTKRKNKTETGPKYLFDPVTKVAGNRKIPFWERENEENKDVTMAWLTKTVDKKVRTRSGKVLVRKEYVNYKRVVSIVSKKQNYLY